MPSKSDAGWSLGRTGRELGIPVTTLRSWCERYDLGPSTRTPGGHRRFGADDVRRLARMKSLVDDGTPASAAARAAVAAETAGQGGGLGGGLGGTRAADHGSTANTDARLPRELHVDVFVPTLLDAAGRLDADGVRGSFARAIDAIGVAPAWDVVVVPALRAVGQEWADGALEIEHEHLVSDVLAGELRDRVARVERRTTSVTDERGRPVLLASLDEHGLPLVALQAALTEQGVEVRSLGPRMPLPRILSAGRTVLPSALFLWASLALPAGVERDARLPGGRPVLLGGPGWQHPGARGTTSLRDATGRLREAYLHPGWEPPGSAEDEHAAS